MKEKSSTDNAMLKPPMLNGKRHSVEVKYTNKDAQKRVIAFLKNQGPDVSAHELAVDLFAEDSEFSEGFQAYSIVYALEKIFRNILNSHPPEPTRQFDLPLKVVNWGGLPDYLPYLSDQGQLRHAEAGEAQWFHLNAWRETDNRIFRRRSRRNRNINRIVTFFEPYMKGTGTKLRIVCETLKTHENPN